MDKFEILTTTTEQTLANKTCAVLENAGIPVMLEHVELGDVNSGEVEKVEEESRSEAKRSGFRLSVPHQFSKTAMRLADVTSSSYYTCKPTCQCQVCIVM
jgi:hypothetical protein